MDEQEGDAAAPEPAAKSAAPSASKDKEAAHKGAEPASTGTADARKLTPIELEMKAEAEAAEAKKVGGGCAQRFSA